MASGLGAGPLQQPNVSGSGQQASRGSNILQGPLQQQNLAGSLQQPSQLDSLQQSGQLSPLKPSSQLGPLQPSTPLGSQQQPTQLGSYQKPGQASNALQGTFQQPSQLGSYQLPTQPGSYQLPTQPGSYQQPTQPDSYQQPTLASNPLHVSFQQPRQTALVQPTPYQGSLQQANPVSTLTPASMHHLIKSDRGGKLSLSDDNILVNQILASHAPDGREFDTRPLLYLVEDILNRATLNPDGMTSTGTESFEERTRQTGFIGMQDLSFTIDRIACELSYKALGGTDAHQTTLSLFHMLSYYSWDAKLVLTLAAFALHYGEFWLLCQIYSTNQLAKAMALLRQVPSIVENVGSMKPRFDALNELIRVIMEVTRCIVEFKELPSIYITPEVPAMASAIAHFPTAVYWTIRSIVASATQITSLTTMGHEIGISTTEAWELSTLAHKLRNIRDHLKKQLDICLQYIAEKMDDEAFKILVNLFEMIHVDNMKVLRALIYPRDDLLPLYDGSNKRRANLEVLRRKNVLLLISGLNITQDELAILEQIYSESRLQPTRLESQYELVWIPFVDPSIQWTESMQKQFESLQSQMTWYTVYHPSLIGKAVIKFIKEKWHFRNKPILVVLDAQGRVVSPNAIHMMWIWGSNAFPFTSLREEGLWREETWRLELLVDGIDPTVLTWIREGKYIFLYGGDDIEWIRKFTNSAKAVAGAERIPLEIAYVGKGSKREQVRRVIATIVLEKLSTCWQDLTMIWFFWTRLESMLFSKIQLGRGDDHTDLVLQEIKRLLSYDREGGWAVLSRGSSIVVNGHGQTVVTTLAEYDAWKENVAVQGFDVAFKNYHDQLHDQKHPCCRFEFSHTAGKIPEKMRCPQCHRNMEEYTTFLCCHEEAAPNLLY